MSIMEAGPNRRYRGLTSFLLVEQHEEQHLHWDFISLDFGMSAQYPLAAPVKTRKHPVSVRQRIPLAKPLLTRIA